MIDSRSILAGLLNVLMLAALLPILALAAPDEANGTVTNVVDGDTFDLRKAGHQINCSQSSSRPPRR
ncbi:MAG TPA: hypothetical protein PLM24_09870 [Methanothrix sp.]|nr:hypothetical protein [Methanothrix sp.]